MKHFTARGSDATSALMGKVTVTCRDFYCERTDVTVSFANHVVPLTVKLYGEGK